MKKNAQKIVSLFHKLIITLEIWWRRNKWFYLTIMKNENRINQLIIIQVINKLFYIIVYSLTASNRSRGK